MVEFWLNICQIRPPAADNLDDKSIVSEKAAQIYPDLSLASAVSQDVYKYTGVGIEENGQTLEDGALVYIDPNAPRSTSSYVKVWLLNGINKGWQKAVCVSRDFLTLVDKAVDSAATLVEGEQGELFGSA